MSKIRDEYECALVLTHDLIGGKWKLRILWHIIEGHNRFSMLVRAIPNITQKVLFSQLKELEESGLIEKQMISKTPPKVTVYHINKKYENIVPIIQSICEFSIAYAVDHGVTIK